MKFKLIKHIENRVLLKKILPFTFIIPVIGTYLFTLENNEAIDSFGYQIIAYLSFFVCFIIAVYALFFMNSFIIVGNLIFNKNFITIINEKIQTNEIQEIEVYIESHYGEVYSRFSVKQGDKNEINIILQNGEKLEYNFLLMKRSELNYLKNSIAYYKNNGLCININV